MDYKGEENGREKKGKGHQAKRGKTELETTVYMV